MRFIYGILLVIFSFTATWKLTIGERIIARGDLLLYFYPLRDYAAQAVREGRLPLWNPYTFMGTPFLANSQVGFFYPFNLLTAWLPAELALSYQIPLHLAIVSLGMYVLALQGLRLSPIAAFASAMTLGLGGYFGAQAEHINQVQALAWLPFQLLVIFNLSTPSTHSVSLSASPAKNIARTFWLVYRNDVASLCVFALIIAFQVFAGHTQSLFISLVTVGITACVRLFALPVKTAFIKMGILILAGVFGGWLSAVQLLPTYELSQWSARGTRMTLAEAASFSWRPWVISRALLPPYGDPLFPEYISYIGVAGLALAVLACVALFLGRKNHIVGKPHFVLAITLLLLGFVLAIGISTPLFSLLYAYVPGFSQFRVQARWLIMFNVGVAMLVGLGVEHLPKLQTYVKPNLSRWVILVAWVVVLISLIALLLWGVRFSLDVEYKNLPATLVLVGWGVSIIIVTLLLGLPGRWVRTQQNLLVMGLAVELLIASQFQPFARATDRQALTSLRPATAHLRVEYEQNTPSKNVIGVFDEMAMGKGRILSLSGLFFDPGDKAEQSLIYAAQLTPDELYDRIIASKQKEILTPNLSLYYRLPSVDGYDGGLLPTRSYADFVRQMMPSQTENAQIARSVDGRLREFLKEVPSSLFLEQMAVRYVLADKTADVFVEDVYYDVMFSAAISPTLVLPLSPYSSTHLGLLLNQTAVATASVIFNDNTQQQFSVVATPFVAPNTGEQFGYVKLSFGGRKTPITLTLGSMQANVRLRAMSNIDGTDRTFIGQMVTGDHAMRIIYSGDTKIYQNLKPNHRAWLIADRTPATVAAASQNQSPQIMQLPATIHQDEPERVVIQLPKMASGEGDIVPATYSNVRVILRDACYAGWVAKGDGIALPITCENGIARVVSVLPNMREVVFSFEPKSVQWGLVLSVFAWLAWLGLCGAYVWFRADRRAHEHAPPAP